MKEKVDSILDIDKKGIRKRWTRNERRTNIALNLKGMKKEDERSEETKKILKSTIKIQSNYYWHKDKKWKETNGERNEKKKLK